MNKVQLVKLKVSQLGLRQTTNLDAIKLSKTVFLNRRDESRFRDLQTFLPGLETSLRLKILSLLPWIRLKSKKWWKIYT